MKCPSRIPTWRKSAAAFSLVAACAGFGSSTQAQNTATFAVNLAAVTCTIKYDRTLSFKINVNDLPDVGSVGPFKDIWVILDNCEEQGTGLTVKTYFYNATPGAVVDGRLQKGEGTGAGWEYEIFPTASYGAPPITTRLHVGTSPVPVPAAYDPGYIVGAPGVPDIWYAVRMRRNGELVAGKSTATATMVLYYQ